MNCHVTKIYTCKERIEAKVGVFTCLLKIIMNILDLCLIIDTIFNARSDCYKTKMFVIIKAKLW